MRKLFFYHDSLITYFNVEHSLPSERLTKITTDLLGFAVSEGTIANKLTHMQRQAKGVIQTIKQHVMDAPWIGSDAHRHTGRRENVLAMGVAIASGLLLCD